MDNKSVRLEGTQQVGNTDRKQKFLGFDFGKKKKLKNDEPVPVNESKGKTQAPASSQPKEGYFRRVMRRSGLRRLVFFAAAVVAVYAVVVSGATPVRYRLSLGDVSAFDVLAPRDVVNILKTEASAIEAAAGVEPVVILLDGANISMLNKAHSTLNALLETVEDVRERIAAEAVEEPENGYFTALFRAESPEIFNALLTNVTEEELKLLIGDNSNANLQRLRTVSANRVLADLFLASITAENLDETTIQGKAQLDVFLKERPWSTIGHALISHVLKPNSRIDRAATEAKRDAFVEEWISENPVIIGQDERILNKDDIVTEDIWNVLTELNLIEDEGGVDLSLHAATFALVLMLSFMVLLSIKRFHPQVFSDPNLTALTSLTVIIVCGMAWVVQEYLDPYAVYLLPVSVAPVLIATLAGLAAAVTVNLALSAAFMVMFGGDPAFFLMAFIGGTLAAFLTYQANQRRRVSMSGVVIGIVNAAVVVSMGVLDKEATETLLNVSGLAFLNGIFSMILAVGLLPFLEGAFNVITPFKLMELADPNHPLLKRLLIEAPGTWHHSLMVGNLAETATRAIGGNALLARVGAYYHDIGKLKRPNFFKENQLGGNPHEKLTPNLSTLVITSHTKDGDDLAAKYRLPKSIRGIIRQHHGSTLVAYFYHKALLIAKDGVVDPNNFRYEGPVPDSRESAVVLLADSIEAAVRAQPDKIQGKIVGLVRKIIRDKLDDGQLDRCDLTLKDLSTVADSFFQVLVGAYHVRLEYPEIDKKEEIFEGNSEFKGTIHKME